MTHSCSFILVCHRLKGETHDLTIRLVPKSVNELVNLESVDISMESERDYCYWYELVDAACKDWPFIPLETAKRMNLAMTANLQDVTLRETLSGPPPDLQKRTERMLSSVSEGPERSMFGSRSVASQEGHEGTENGDFLERERKRSSVKDRVVSMVTRGKNSEKKERAISLTSLKNSDEKGLPSDFMMMETKSDADMTRDLGVLHSREVDTRTMSAEHMAGHYDQFHDHHNPQKSLDAPHYYQQPEVKEGVVKEGIVTKFPTNNKTGSPKERYMVLTYYRDTGGALTYYERKNDFDRSRTPKGRLHLTGQVTVNVNFKDHRRVCSVTAEVRKDGEEPEEADRYMRTESVNRRPSAGMMDKLKQLVPQEGMVFESIVFFTDGEETEDWARKISQVLQTMGSEDSD